MAEKLSKYHGLQLKIPGRLIHLTKFATSKALSWCFFGSGALLSFLPIGKECCSTKRLYLPVSRPIEAFDKIVVSSTMGADHFPDQYYYELCRLRDIFVSPKLDL